MDPYYNLVNVRTHSMERMWFNRSRVRELPLRYH